MDDPRRLGDAGRPEPDGEAPAPPVFEAIPPPDRTEATDAASAGAAGPAPDGMTPTEGAIIAGPSDATAAPDHMAPPSDTIAQGRPADRGDGPPWAPEVGIEGPLRREQAVALLDRAAELMDSGDFRDAAVHYRRVVGFNEPAVTAAGLLGLGLALYRLDHDDAAVETWESILELPETPSTYRAWREIAAAKVRSGDLSGAIVAYREADRRAPAGDKPEIANRLGWLAKETGNTRASSRYFARGRGAGPAFPLPWVIIGITVVVSFSALSAGGDFLYELLQLDKPAVASGELWRLWTVTLLHSPNSLLHLAFNMYALYLTGPIVEQMYGSRVFLLFYLLTAAAGSIASHAFGPVAFGVGASGAIFGLIGVLIAASRTHNPVLDRQSRAFVGQLGTLVIINLVFGFVVPGIDNTAHIGGLLAGLWVGFLLVPGRVPTLQSLWQGTGSQGSSMVLPMLGVALLVVVLVIGLLFGNRTWGPLSGVVGGRDAPAASTMACSPPC